MASPASRLFEIALVLVRLDHVCSLIVNANHRIILLLPYGAPAPSGNSRPLKLDGTPGLLPSNGSDLGVELSPSSKNYRPPHPTGMRGGCSPQNNLYDGQLTGSCKHFVRLDHGFLKS